MSTLRKLKLATLCCIISYSSSAQSELNKLVYTNLNILADSSIAILQAKKIDTIICFYPYELNMALATDNLNGLGAKVVMQNIYLIYSFNNKTKLNRFISYIEPSEKDCCEPKLNKSQTLELTNDTLLNWFKSMYSKIERENMLPYIYKYESDSISGFEIGYSTHSSSYLINIYAGSNYISKTIDEPSLRENPSGVANLNFKYNSNTALYKYYFKLKEFLESKKSLFNFTK